MLSPLASPPFVKGRVDVGVLIGVADGPGIGVELPDLVKVCVQTGVVEEFLYILTVKDAPLTEIPAKATPVCVL